jgi:ABC-type uncharacterized transport system substrate-binding protein
MKLLRRCLLFLLSAFVWLGTCHAQKVLIVQGEGNAGFAQAASACVSAIGVAGFGASDIAVQSSGAFAASPPSGEPPRLVITLGGEALTAVLKWIPPRSALLAGLVPRSAFERGVKDAGKRSGLALSAVYLDQPLVRQVDAMRLMFPNAKNVGVVFGPESQSVQAVVASTLRSRNMELLAAQVGAGVSVYSALKSALDSVDVFFALADPQVFNSTTIGNILLTTYAAQVPVVAFSPAYVKAGSLAAIYSSPVQIGGELGAIAAGFIQTGQLPSPRYPNEFEVMVNASVARSLGVTVDAAAVTERLKRMEKRP